MRKILCLVAICLSGPVSFAQSEIPLLQISTQERGADHEQKATLVLRYDGTVIHGHRIVGERTDLITIEREATKRLILRLNRYSAPKTDLQKYLNVLAAKPISSSPARIAAFPNPMQFEFHHGTCTISLSISDTLILENYRTDPVVAMIQGILDEFALELGRAHLGLGGATEIRGTSLQPRD